MSYSDYLSGRDINDLINYLWILCTKDSQKKKQAAEFKTTIETIIFKLDPDGILDMEYRLTSLRNTLNSSQ